MSSLSLVKLFANQSFDIGQVCELFNDTLLAESVRALNLGFSPMRLSKRSRKVEALPTEKKQLSSFRTRMGTILEYALSTELQALLNRLYGDQLLLTFAVAHEYPDFYLRDKNLTPRMRIEMKGVDADSDEQAARFDAPTSEIDANTDIVVLIGWEWKNTENGLGEYPYIFAYVAVPAAEIAKERDQRLVAIGGKIEDGQVLVPSTKNPGTMVPDPGNYGKLWRIISRDRRGSSHLSDHMRRFEVFMHTVDQHAVDRGARKQRRYSGLHSSPGTQLL